MFNIFAMHGYGAYVWSAYGIAFSVIAINLFYVINFKSKAIKEINNNNE